MSNKSEAIRLYYKGLTKFEIQEHNLDLRCVKNPDGGYLMWDDGSNPIFPHSHASAKQAWAETLEWLKSRDFV